jgi:hypothetical protein
MSSQHLSRSAVEKIGRALGILVQGSCSSVPYSSSWMTEPSCASSGSYCCWLGSEQRLARPYQPSGPSAEPALASTRASSPSGTPLPCRPSSEVPVSVSSEEGLVWQLSELRGGLAWLGTSARWKCQHSLVISHSIRLTTYSSLELDIHVAGHLSVRHLDSVGARRTEVGEVGLREYRGDAFADGRVSSFLLRDNLSICSRLGRKTVSARLSRIEGGGWTDS